MQERPFGITVALTTTTTTNLLNPPTTTGGVPSGEFSGGDYQGGRITVTHMRVTNNTTGALALALWRGATGINSVGKEFAWGGIASTGTLTNGVTVPPGGQLDWYGKMPFDTTKFLVGGASAAGLTLEIDGSIGIA
jgi:hypothetical protein